MRKFSNSGNFVKEEIDSNNQNEHNDSTVVGKVSSGGECEVHDNKDLNFEGLFCNASLFLFGEAFFCLQMKVEFKITKLKMRIPVICPFTVQLCKADLHYLFF